MQKFKRKSLYLALVAAVGSVGIANTASAAVHINGNGLGQVLIYPYYTTRAGMDTYLSVVNTTGSSKAVKVRFTEGKNSREVLDFNLYMSPQDMWTAAVVNTASGAKLVTADKSCTAPEIPASGQNFVNYAFSGPAIQGINQSGGDGETASLDRTREGYFEIIEMGTITNTAIIAAITHVSGVPANCAVIRAANMDMGAGTTHTVGGQSAEAAPSTGHLAGTASLINVAGGTDFGYDPVVLDAFAPPFATNLWFSPGIIFPDLRSADIDSVVFDANSPTGVIRSQWPSSKAHNTVNALLMHDNIINEYVLDTATLSGTDWVITMPTKRYSVPVRNPDPSLALPASNQLFSPFTHKFWLNGACEPVHLRYWDREEDKVENVDFSPPAPGGGTALCWETNVVTFNDSHVLQSVNETNIPVKFQNGWLRMQFDAIGVNSVAVDANGQKDADSNSTPTVHSVASHSLTSIDGDTYLGLPTVGFMVQDFINQNAAPGVMATYGGNFNHKYTTDVTDGPIQ